MAYKYRKCEFADRLIDHGRGCIVSVEKMKLPMLEGKKDYQDWKFSLESHLRRNKMLDPVTKMISDHDYYEVKDSQRVKRIIIRVKGQPDIPDNNVTWDDKQLSVFRDLSSKASQFLAGRARTLIQQNKCSNVVDVMRTMLIAFGCGSEMEKEKMMEEFLSVKWNPAKEC